LRALREQSDWRALRARTRGSPYATAFFVLIEELGVVPDQHAVRGPTPGNRAARTAAVSRG